MQYKIEWKVPANYDPSTVLHKLPSPIGPQLTEIYNYRVEKDGFFLLDHLIDQRVAGHAMKLFVDEALAHSDSVSIRVL